LSIAVERLNTDAAIYGGSNVGNSGQVFAEHVPWHGRPASVSLTLPPLSTIVFKRAGSEQCVSAVLPDSAGASL
jgi:1,4-alpha-glucan branching enzyme